MRETKRKIVVDGVFVMPIMRVALEHVGLLNLVYFVVEWSVEKVLESNQIFIHLFEENKLTLMLRRI